MFDEKHYFKQYDKALQRDMWRIAFMTLLFVSMILYAGSIFVSSLEENYKKSMVQELNNYAEVTQEAINARIKGDFATLDAIALCIPQLGVNQPSDLRILLNEINMGNDFLRMGYATLDGEVEMLDISGRIFRKNFAGEAFFEKALRGEPAISAPSLDKFEGVQFMRYAVPVVKDHVIIGILIAGQDASFFRQILDINMWSGKGYANIFDGNGDFVLRSNSRLMLSNNQTIFDLGEIPREDKLQLLWTIPSYSCLYSYKADTGDNMSAVYKPLFINGWYLQCALLDSYVSGPFSAFSVGSFVVMVLSLLIFGLLASFAIRTMMQSQSEMCERDVENSILIAQSGKYVIHFDIQTLTAYNSEKTMALLGVPKMMIKYPESLIKAGVVCEESQKDYLKLFADMLSGKSKGEANIHVLTTANELRWLHFDYTLVAGVGEHPTESIISFYDNTEIYEKEIIHELWQNEMATKIANSTAYMEANITKNRIEKIKHFRQQETVEVHDLLLSDYVKDFALGYVYPEDAKFFRQAFERARLLSNYFRGLRTETLEVRLLRDGQIIWHEIVLNLVRYPQVDAIKLYAVLTDIDSAHREQEKLVKKASNDELTGLLNRAATMAKIEQYLAGEGADGDHSLFMIDIDNFKNVNDTFGHQAGDTVLTNLGNAIKHCFRDTDIVGRIGGDEFFAFMKNTGSIRVVKEKARELVMALQCIYVADNKHQDLSGSVGVAMYRGSSVKRPTFAELYDEADNALYRAKEKGKNAFSLMGNEEIPDEPQPIAETSAPYLSLSLQSLLNNIGCGVQIYHRTVEGTVRPIFCNNMFLQMLGDVSKEEIMLISSHDNFDGVHPEDRSRFVAAYDKALGDRSVMQCTYRALGAAKRYYWVNLTANFVWHEDGSCAIYSVYSPADELMKQRAEQERKFTEFLEDRRFVNESTITSFRLNLSENWCGAGQSDDADVLSLQEKGTVDDFFVRVAEHIPVEQERKAYRKLFNRANLLNSYSNGETRLKMEHRYRFDDNSTLWVRGVIDMMANPDTHDIMAYVYAYDIDALKTSEIVVNKLLQTDYAFLGKLDVQSGLLTIFGGKAADRASIERAACGRYDDILQSLLEGRIADEDYEDCLEALSMRHILEALTHSEAYTCVFRAKTEVSARARFIQWRFRYFDDSKDSILATQTDITDIVEGGRDVLTKLYNSEGFYCIVRKQLHDSPEQRFAIARLDIDSFKLVNDTLGYDRGNEVLSSIGVALRNYQNCGIISARIEADHFACFFKQDVIEPEVLFANINAALEQYRVEFPLGIHMGVYYIDNKEIEVSQMSDRALLALLAGKKDFAERVTYYDESLRAKLLEEQELVSDFKEALRQKQFVVYFQPQVDYVNGTIIGAEALVRWQHPVKGLLSPAIFIPLFESNGLVSELDEYVWDRTCYYLHKWFVETQREQSIAVAVNISRVDIYKQNLCEILQGLVAKYQLPPGVLKLEITESAYMENAQQLTITVNKLRAAGFKVGIDDFGTGYSSLNTLKDIYVDALKLDMRFLEHNENDERGGNIVSSIIRMAHWLKMPVIAEGVETKEQADYLKSLNCFYMQGYYFDKPMSADAFEKLLQTSELGQFTRYRGVNLDSVAAFWDPSAQTALLFNSFIGGAAILEYSNGKPEILRANDNYYSELRTTRAAYVDSGHAIFDRLDAENSKLFLRTIDEAVCKGTDEASACVLHHPSLVDGTMLWTKVQLRLLAQNGEDYLLYMAITDLSEQKQMQEELEQSKVALQDALKKS